MKIFNKLFFVFFLLTSHSLLADPFGTELGSYNNVKAYSNGSVGYVSNTYNTASGINTGMKWQCVEYVNRYYYDRFQMDIRVAGHNATNYYPNASQHGLTPFPNNGTTSPQVGDLLCFSDGSAPTDYGHVAIVREVNSNSLKVIQQNVTQSASDANYTISMSVSGGHYNVSGSSIGSDFICQGWLRKPTTSEGYGKVSQGLNIIPSVITRGGSLQVTFIIKETLNLAIHFDSITCAILDNNNNLKFNLTRFSNINLSANGTWNYSSSGGFFSNLFPAGMYKAVARGYKSGPGWFDFTVTGNGQNPVSFQVVNPTGIEKISDLIPENYKLFNNYPNPFNPSTKVKFDLPKYAAVRIQILNITGSIVKDLVNENLPAGRYEAEFDGSNISRGFYYYRIKANEFIETKKMILLK